MDIINWGRGKFNVPAFSARKKDGEYAGGISIDPLSSPSTLIFLAFYKIKLTPNLSLMDFDD